MVKVSKEISENLLKNKYYSKIVFYLAKSPDNATGLEERFNRKKKRSIIARQMKLLSSESHMYIFKSDKGEKYYKKNCHEVNYSRLIEKFFRFFVDKKFITIKNTIEKNKTSNYLGLYSLRPINILHKIEDLIARKPKEKLKDFTQKPIDIDEALIIVRDEYLNIFNSYCNNFYLVELFKIFISEANLLQIETIYDFFEEIENVIGNFSILNLVKSFQMDLLKPFNLDSRLKELDIVLQLSSFLNNFNSISQVIIEYKMERLIKKEVLIKDPEIQKLINSREDIMRMINGYSKSRREDK